jgi:hypothetical protein
MESQLLLVRHANDVSNWAISRCKQKYANLNKKDLNKQLIKAMLQPRMIDCKLTEEG